MTPLLSRNAEAVRGLFERAALGAAVERSGNWWEERGLGAVAGMEAQDVAGCSEVGDKVAAFGKPTEGVLEEGAPLLSNEEKEKSPDLLKLHRSVVCSVLQPLDGFFPQEVILAAAKLRRTIEMEIFF